MGNLCPSAGAKASEDPTIYKEFVDTTPTPIRKEKRKFLLLGGGFSFFFPSFLIFLLPLKETVESRLFFDSCGLPLAKVSLP